MPMSIIIATASLATVWILLTPKNQPGRRWHLMLAPLPLAAAILIKVIPAPSLSHALWVWSAAGLAGLGVVVLAWIAGTATRNHGMMDVAYPLAPAAIAWCAAALVWPRVSSVGWVALGLVSIWSLRLAVQTWRQNHAVEREPYATWRARGGTQWIWRSFFQVHLLQAVTLWVWSMPLAFAITASYGSLAILAGAAIWLTGFALQAISDAQLAHFKRDPANRGQILDTGLWALVRQPNYLGESLMWWSYLALALAAPWGWIALPGPLFATWFMGFGSAGPFKERHMARTRGEAWRAYCARTPRFFPWPRPQGLA